MSLLGLQYRDGDTCRWISTCLAWAVFGLVSFIGKVYISQAVHECSNRWLSTINVTISLIKASLMVLIRNFGIFQGRHSSLIRLVCWKTKDMYIDRDRINE